MKQRRLVWPLRNDDTMNSTTRSIAIIPSLAYFFPEIPCTPYIANRWNQKNRTLCEEKFGMDRTTLKFDLQPGSLTDQVAGVHQH